MAAVIFIDGGGLGDTVKEYSSWLILPARERISSR